MIYIRLLFHLDTELIHHADEVGVICDKHGYLFVVDMHLKLKMLRCGEGGIVCESLFVLCLFLDFFAVFGCHGAAELYV